MNRFVGVGRLTKDVDLRYLQSGKAVGNFTIAINRPFKNKNGDYEADFINVVQFGKGAENLANYMKKGSQIGVDGRIQTRTFETKDGKTAFVTEVVADSVQFLESKKQQSNERSQVDAYNKEWQGAANDGEPTDIDDSVLPF